MINIADSSDTPSNPDLFATLTAAIANLEGLPEAVQVQESTRDKLVLVCGGYNFPDGGREAPIVVEATGLQEDQHKIYIDYASPINQIYDGENITCAPIYNIPGEQLVTMVLHGKQKMIATYQMALEAMKRGDEQQAAAAIQQIIDLLAKLQNFENN